MPETRVVNINTSTYDVYIGRAGRGQDGYFGNPYYVGKDGTRSQVIGLYREHFINKVRLDEEFRNRVKQLKGKTLGCFCKPDACHGDVIKEWLDVTS